VFKEALDEGLEWTAKVSQYEIEHLWQHALSIFESTVSHIKLVCFKCCNLKVMAIY